MNSLKQKIKFLNPTHVKFHLNQETLKEMIVRYVYNKTGKQIIKSLNCDLRAIEDTGRVLIDYDSLTDEEEQAFLQAGLLGCCDDDLADIIEVIVGDYFKGSVSVYCTKISEGLWVLEDFDVTMDFEEYVNKRGAK